MTLVRKVFAACSLASVLAGAFAGYTSRADASARGDAARRGAEWIGGEQSDDGAFFTSGQRVDQTAETLAAMIAGGVTGSPVKRAVSYLRKHAEDGATRGAYTGRIVAALVAAGQDPRAFAGNDLVAKLDEQYDDSSGAYDAENLFTNLMGANGAVAAHRELPAKALEYIAGNACDGGGFGYENRCAKGPDVDTSAWVINVYAAAGRKGDAAVASARSYILSVQQDDGGFAFTKDKSTSADSTGLVLSAIEALGERTTKAPWRQDDGGDPVKALLPLQHPSGGFRFIASSKSPNALSTQNAVPGLAKVSYPVPRTEPVPSPVPSVPSAAPSSRSPRPRETTRPPANTGSGATSTATQASPGPSGVRASELPPAGSSPIVFTPGPAGAPFADSTDPAETIPAPVLWAGLGGVIAVAGAGTWVYLKRRGRP